MVRHAQDSIRDAYDIASEAYARKFINELDHKPLDRAWLGEFATLVGTQQPVLDLGCGPGHTTAYLTSLGLNATGVDLSPKMIDAASRTFPHVHFMKGNFFALSNDSSSVAGIVALYCIVHLSPDELQPAITEMFRVLRGGGVLLLSFHVGSEVLRVEKFLDTSAVLDFRFFDPIQVQEVLTAVGFDVVELRVREPYDTEYPSNRCYVFARKPPSMA